MRINPFVPERAVKRWNVSLTRSVTNGGYSLHRTWRTPQNLEITSFSKKRCKRQNLGITWRTPTWGSPQTWGSILKLGITTFPQKRCNGLNLGITFKTWGSPKTWGSTVMTLVTDRLPPRIRPGVSPRVQSSYNLNLVLAGHTYNGGSMPISLC